MKPFTLAILAIAAITAAARPAAFSLAAEPAHTTWDSVFTDAQAKNGESLYKAQCMKCHLASLAGGDDGSPLTGKDFNADFEGATLDQLFDQAYNMPPDNPKSVPRAQIADIVAYLLAQNHFPAGSTPLTENPDQLKDIKIVFSKP
jgi:mono/diheme cytochrome c family protein